MINVTIIYPGASPQEIEEGLILKIEKNLRGLAGIDQTTSVSSENRGTVSIEVSDDYKAADILDDVKNAVERLNPYPVGAEKPIITIPKMRTLSVSVAIYGNADLWALKKRAELFRDDLLDKDGISQVSLQGIPNREIALLISESDMRRYGLTFSEIQGAIRGANIDLSGGMVDGAKEQLLIRAYGRQNYAEKIAGIIVRSLPDGRTIRVKDIAEVREQWSDIPNKTYFNGQRSIVINIDKTIAEDIISISEMVTEYLPSFMEKYPEVKAEIIRDRTIHLRQRINLLLKNGLIGFVLVLLSLGLFLNWRLALWVALGIPISFAGMFIIANWYGITINVISLFGMIIVVGILVDDAIIVAESAYQETEKGFQPDVAALKGTTDVASPVFSAVMTTILAFTPFFFFAGTMGKIIDHLAIVVVGALIFSLIESLTILPAHIAHSKGMQPAQKMGRIRAKSEAFYHVLTEKIYGPLLKRSMRAPIIVAASAVAFVMLTFGLIRGQFVEVSAFPHIDRDDITMNVALTTGTQEEQTDSLLQEIEKKIWQANEEMKKKREDGNDVILSIQREIGRNREGDVGGHAGQLKIELLPGGTRKVLSYKIANQIRKVIGPVPGIQKLSFGGGHWGKPINISLKSNNLKDLSRATEQLKQMLGEYPTLKDIVDSDVQGQREIRLRLKPAAHAAGLSLRDIAGQVRQGFFGQEVQRFQRGEDEIRVWIRYREEDRTSLGNLESMRIRTVDGREIPLATLADYSIERGRVDIKHLDGRREVHVEAALANPELSVSSINKDIEKNVLPEITRRFEEVRVSFEGRARSNRKFTSSLFKSFPMALAGIFFILILVFRSLLQPFIIILMIPLGICGSIWGHYLTGNMLSRFSTFGLIALSGIVINDSIVFIDQINKNLRDRIPLFEAVHSAGISRLRPIILTTITTVLGMLPLLLETSRQAQFLIPMAISISYGLMFGSLFILFVIPSLFLGLNRIRYTFAKLDNPNITREEVEPAVGKNVSSQTNKSETT